MSKTAVNWTKEQQQVIESRGCHLLVSAAAGSGKTAVLVERIIRMVTEGENPLDIDRLLVMTFTNAAAAEMRERIGEAIEARLLEDPHNQHLQVQSALVHHAKITTIDSFCLNIIREHFNMHTGREANVLSVLWKPSGRERAMQALKIILCRCTSMPRAILIRSNGWNSAEGSFLRRKSRPCPGWPF